MLVLNVGHDFGGPSHTYETVVASLAKARVFHDLSTDIDMNAARIVSAHIFQAVAASVMSHFVKHPAA